MLRVDSYYLYTVGWQIHPLSDFTHQTTYAQARFPIYIAEGTLAPLIGNSVYRLRTSVDSGMALLNAIRALKSKIDSSGNSDEPLGFQDAWSITTALTTFEAVLGAELSLTPVYVVTPKGGFDVPALIEAGQACFPADLESKVPEAIQDLKQATRCIAFELFTSAGFHLHRANEAVLRRYWDAVTNGSPRPTTRNMGDYLNGLAQQNAGDPRVRAALKDLKDLHRNPLLHPDDSINNLDEAVALMNGVHTVILHMLRAIPVTQPAATKPAGGLLTSQS